MSLPVQPGPTLMPGDPRYDGLAKELAMITSGQLPPNWVPQFVHPLANLLPMIPAKDRKDFRASLAIKQNHPCILKGGRMLDGRNRARDLIELGKPIATVIFTGSDREAFELVDDENYKRRHLDESQRADYAARVANFRVGDNQHTRQPAQTCAPSLFAPQPSSPAMSTEDSEPAPAAPLLSQTEAAEKYNVSRRSVQTATVYQKEGAPELSQAVQEGKMSVSVAADIAKALPIEEQKQVAALDEKEILARAKQIRKDANDKRRADRVEDIKRKAEASTSLPTGRKFPLIYMDPPTKYNAGDSDRSTENHYPTMTEDQIAALPISDLALEDAVLLIWTTVPWLHKTLRMLEGWGFEYKSCAVWDKETIGLGFWWQNQHEILIGASRGKPAFPENGSIMGSSVYREKKGRHSAKPEYFRGMIDGVPEWAGLPKVELFPRINGSLPENWFGWGNEAQVPKQQSLEIEQGEAAE